MTEVIEVTGTSVPNIPADYAGLGVVHGYDPCTANKLRLFLVGPSGEGKTTFVSSSPDTIILDYEGGANAVPKARAVRVKIENYEHSEKLFNKLLDDGAKNNRRFNRVVIDSVDEYTEMIGARLEHEKNTDDITEFGKAGHGWALIRNRSWNKIKALERAGYAWTIVGHLKEKTITDPTNMKEITVPRPLLFDSYASKIIRNADMYVSAYKMKDLIPIKREVINPKNPKETLTVDAGHEEVEKYYLFAKTVAQSNVKATERGVANIKAKIELPHVGGWDVFANEYNSAIEAQRKELETM